MASQPIVFIVDDDPSMRRSTSMLLDSVKLCHEAFERATDFLESYNRKQPGCLIVDLSMPGMGGMDLVHRLRIKGIHIPVLIVSGTGSIPMAVEGMKLGIVDFLEKPTNPQQLLAKVREALQQDADQRAAEAEIAPILKRWETLTAREKELISLLVQGLSSKQVANQLGISTKTVENHRTNIMQKTGALNIADLTRMSMIISPR